MGLLDLFKGGRAPLVERGFEDIKTMLRHGHKMFAAAAAYVLDNEILDVDLGAIDHHINDGEQNLRRVVLEHLTIDPDRELLFSLKLLSIVHEAERIGDIAKTLAKTADLAKKPRMGPVVEPLRSMRDRILVMFEHADRAFVDADEAGARRLMADHEQIKADAAVYLQELADRDDITPNEAIVYALCVRLMSRVSSHLANVASAVASPFDQIRRSPTDR